MRKLGFSLAFLILLCHISADAQTQTASPDAAPAAAPTETAPSGAKAAPAKGLSVADVIKLSQAGLSDNVIIGKIKKNGEACGRFCPFCRPFDAY